MFTRQCFFFWVLRHVQVVLFCSGRALAVLLAAIILAGCSAPTSDDVRQLAVRWRLADPPLPAPLFVSVLVDASAFSSGTPEHLRDTLTVVTSAIAERRGTILLFALDATYAVREVARYTAPPLSDASLAARDAYVRRVRGEAFNALWPPGQAALEHPPVRSRVLAALTNIAQTTVPVDHEAILVTLSDLRDTDLIGDCRGLPSWDAFEHQLAQARFLDADSLHARVLIPYYSLSMPAEGCGSNERRAAQLKDLFTKVFERAGATSVEFSTTAPLLLK